MFWQTASIFSIRKQSLCSSFPPIFGRDVPSIGMVFTTCQVGICGEGLWGVSYGLLSMKMIVMWRGTWLNTSARDKQNVPLLPTSPHYVVYMPELRTALNAILDKKRCALPISSVKVMQYKLWVIGHELWAIHHAYKTSSQSYDNRIMIRGGLVHRLERSAYIRVVPGSTPGTPTTLVMHEELCRLYKELWEKSYGDSLIGVMGYLV